MTDIVSVLKEALELEKQALEKYNLAIPGLEHKETREAVEKYAEDKNQQIDALHWMILAEAGQLDGETTPVAKTEEEAKPAGKCPFTGQFAAMGIDMSKMGEMMGDPEKRAEMMEKMGGDFMKDESAS